MFKEIAKITLRHHYYRNGYCKDIRLYQDNQTVQLMRRSAAAEESIGICNIG